MSIEHLRSLLAPLLGRELDTLYAGFSSRHGGDTTAFLVHLHREGRIDAEVLREAIASGEVSVTLSEAGVRREGPRHELLGLLGRGAMGEVHVARDVELHRNVAVKRMDPAIAHHPQLAARFRTEVQITAQLDHPAIVPVYGIEYDDKGVPSYAMKLVRGKTLEDLLAEARAAHAKGREPDEDHDLPARLDLFLQICNAIHYAHSRGVVHRDLKPENVMIGPFHEVLVMDWGIAKPIGGREEALDVDLGAGRAHQTQLGLAIGTPAFMSPEQARGDNDKLDGRSDQYALGLILFELVSLKRAITGKNALHVLGRAAQGQKDPLVHAFGRRIPRELAGIVAKATARKKKDRYPDVEALADDVRRYLRDEAVLARPDSLLQRLGRWVGRHRQLTLGLGVALVFAVFGVGALSITGGVVALELSRLAAAGREERLSELLATVGRQAHRMDTELLRFEALVAGLAGATEHALRHEPDPDVPLYLVSTWKDAPPPDLQESPPHGGPVSFDHMDLFVHPSVDSKAADRPLRQLAGLQPYLRNLLVRSKNEEACELAQAAQRDLVVTEGVPVVWAYVALEQGLLGGLPGSGDYPADYDPRVRPWYEAGKRGRGPQWSPAYVDLNGAGLVVPVTRAVHDPDGAFLGVAVLDVSIQHIVDDLLDPPGLAAPVEAYLVDRDGKVVVQSSLKDRAAGGTEHEPAPFPYPAVLAAMAGDDSGHLVLDDGQLATWAPLDAIDWTYVVVGDGDALLGGPS